MAILRSRNAAFLTVPEASEGVFQSPSAAVDAVLVENPTINFDPQNIETDEVTGSLDGRGPILGGLQASMNFRVYLKGQGVGGVAPEVADILKACGLLETVMKTDLVATTISVTGGNTIADSGNGLAVFTVGTALILLDPANPGNNGRELLVSASAAGSLTVTNMDGSPPALTNFAAGPSITLRRGVAAVAATAGAGTQFTAQAPWAATDQLYTHLPVWLSGDPAVAALAGIVDYSAARIAKLADTFSPVLSVATKASIPANVLYTPHSGVIPSNSCEFYMDGTRYQFAGVRGDLSATFNAGGASWLDVSLRGMFVAKGDVAMPTPTYDASRPGTFRKSAVTVNSLPVGLSSLTINLGNQLAFPPNPNAAEGFDAPQILRRRTGGQMDPLAGLEATTGRMTAFRAGAEVPIHARVLGGAGAVAGNRVGIMVPKAFYESLQPGDNQGMATEQIGFFARGQDRSFGLCFF